MRASLPEYSITHWIHENRVKVPLKMINNLGSQSHVRSPLNMRELSAMTSPSSNVQVLKYNSGNLSFADGNQPSTNHQPTIYFSSPVKIHVVQRLLKLQRLSEWRHKLYFLPVMKLVTIRIRHALHGKRENRSTNDERMSRPSQVYQGERNKSIRMWQKKTGDE